MLPAPSPHGWGQARTILVEAIPAARTAVPVTREATITMTLVSI